MHLSVVIPVFNENSGINILLDRLTLVLNSLNSEYEIVFVNDGSTDETQLYILKAMGKNKKIRLINLVRNYGHMEALSVGLKASKGLYILSMDSDLQDPPELIVEMYKMISSNSHLDVVQAVRTDRSADSFFKRNTAKLFYVVSRSITKLSIIENAADFRIMTRKTVDIINELPEPNKIMRFLIPELGFNVGQVGFVRAKRASGESKYNLNKMFSLAFNSIIGFSTKPLRIISIFGFALSLVFNVGALITFGVWIWARTIPGWTSIVLILLSSNALILGSLGMIGEYVAKIRDTTYGRPSSRSYEVFC